MLFGLFCKHNWVHQHNLMMALNDDWPCKVNSVEMCSKCKRQRTVTKVIGG